MEIKNVLVANKTKPKSEIPKSIKVLFLVLMGLGADCGVSEILNSKIRYIVKYYKIFFIIVEIIILASAFHNLSEQFWYWSNLFTSITTYVMLNKTKYRVYNFLKDMHNVRKGITAIEREIFGVTLSMYLVTMSLTIFSLTVYRCAYDKKFLCKGYSAEHNALYTIACQSVDVVTVVQVVIYYYIYCHVKFLRTSLKNGLDISTFTKHYINLAEYCDKIRSFYNTMVSNVHVHIIHFLP